jgi:hypothetical protein
MVVQCLRYSIFQIRYYLVCGSASHRSLSSTPSRNLRNITPDLQGYPGQYTLGSLAPRLLGQCSLGSPASSPPWIWSYTGSCLLPAGPSPQTLPLSSLLISHVAHSPSLLVFTYIAGCFWLVVQSAATYSLWFLPRGFFYPEDGGDTFFRKVGSHKIYAAPHAILQELWCLWINGKIKFNNPDIHRGLAKNLGTAFS